ncbi:hypothetical protein ACI797_13795 [Geodermatophilus sp. SYSU D00691]
MRVLTLNLFGLGPDRSRRDARLAQGMAELALDHVLVRCGLHGGPTLRITGCRLVFDTPETAVSDHFRGLADLGAPPLS